MTGQQGDLRVPVFLILLGGSALVHQLNRFRLSKKLQETGVVPLRSAPQGFVEIQGFAWPSQGTFAPVHGREAAYCQIVIEQSQGRSWKQIAVCQAGAPFFFVDRTGCALVMPEGAEVDMTSRQVFYRSLSAEQKERLRALVAAGAPHVDFADSILKNFRITERALLAGAPLYVAGCLSAVANRKPAPLAPGAKRFLEKVDSYLHGPMFRLSGVHGHGVATGFASPDLYSQFAAESLPLAAATAGDELPFFGLVASTSERRLFFADCYQSDVLKHLRRWLWIKITAAAVAIAAGVMILAVQLASWRR